MLSEIGGPQNISDAPAKFASVSFTDSADLITAVTGRKIRVLSGCIVLATAQTVKFQSGGSTDLTGAIAPGANGGFVIPYTPCGAFETASGTKLNIVCGAAVAGAGWLVYQEVIPTTA